MDEEKIETAEDFLRETDEDRMPAAIAAPHELSGIRLLIRSREEDGIKMRETRLDIPEAAVLVVHLQALITMAFNSVYAQQAQMAQAAGGKQVWTPGG